MKSAKQAYFNYMTKHNIRRSEQRDKILDVFLRTEKHVTIAELYELVHVEHAAIGFATVYRAMKVFLESGLAEEIVFGDGVRRFEHKHGHQHHDHLICTRCGCFFEVINPEIERLQEEIAKQYSFTLESHRLHMFGICKACQRKKQQQCSSEKKVDT